MARKRNKLSRLERKKLKSKYPNLHLPRIGIYGLAVTVLSPVARLAWNMRITRTDMDKVKGQCIVISNHHGRLDWIFVGLALWPRLLNVVITHYHYANPKLRPLLRAAGCISKDQFRPDIMAVKQMMAIAKMGGNIMVFPEGRTIPAGQSETFERSIVKLVRHLNLPLVAVRIDGAFLTMPKWALDIRRGRIDVNVFPLLMPEQIADMSDGEIYDAIVSRLSTDEYAWQEKNHVSFKGGENAEGLENVLYMCPKCGGEFTMESSGSVIKCSHCGNGATLDSYYRLNPLSDDCVIPDNIGEWFKWEKEEVRQMALADEDIEMRGELVLRQILSEKSWLEPVGEGEGVLNREGLRFTGTRKGEPFELFLPLSSIPAIPYGPGESFELYEGDEMLSFAPRMGVTAQKWSILAEVLYNIHCADPNRPAR